MDLEISSILMPWTACFTKDNAFSDMALSGSQQSAGPALCNPIRGLARRNPKICHF